MGRVGSQNLLTWITCSSLNLLCEWSGRRARPRPHFSLKTNDPTAKAAHFVLFHPQIVCFSFRSPKTFKSISSVQRVTSQQRFESRGLWPPASTVWKHLALSVNPDCYSSKFKHRDEAHSLVQSFAIGRTRQRHWTGLLSLHSSPQISQLQRFQVSSSSLLRVMNPSSL